MYDTWRIPNPTRLTTAELAGEGGAINFHPSPILFSLPLAAPSDNKRRGGAANAFRLDPRAI